MNRILDDFGHAAMVPGLFIVDPCGCENSRGAKVRFGMPTISIR